MVKILFFGTPEVAVPFLNEAAKNDEVAGVVTQPDRAASRHLSLHVPEVKAAAIGKNIPVFQPEKFDDELKSKLNVIGADIGIVVSYGRLIPENVFNIPRMGCFNIHFSLLPKYRGAAPVQWALIKGESLTGVSSFWIEKTLDSGPVLIQESLPIRGEDDAKSLLKRLIPLGIEVMNSTLHLLRKERVPGTPQKGEPTFAPILKKEDGKIDWARPATDIINLIRGTNPWPGAYTTGADGKLQGKRLKIIKAELATTDQPDKKGEVIGISKHEGFIVASGKNSILIKEVQPENKSPMGAWDLLQGGYCTQGSKFS